MLIVFFTDNNDFSLALAFFSICSFFTASRKCHIPFEKNLSLLVSSILFVMFLMYRLMFQFETVQAYISQNTETQNYVIFLGGLLITIFVIGSRLAILPIKNSSNAYVLIINNRQVDFLAFLVFAPLVAMILMYFFRFNGSNYVDLYTSSDFAFSLIMKSKFISYSSMILLAISSEYDKKSFSVYKLALLLSTIVYGLLYGLRSPLLVYFLLFIYFYRTRINIMLFVFGILGTVVGFAFIGALRSNFGIDHNLLLSLVEPMLGLGEYVDTMVYALEIIEKESLSYGVSILTSFLGLSDPIANQYAMYIAPDYFEQGGGFGFFMLSEMLINFGVIGSFLVLFYMGYFFTRNFNQNSGLFLAVFKPMFFANVFSLIRNDIGTTFRGVVYTTLCALIIYIVIYSRFFLLRKKSV